MNNTVWPAHFRWRHRHPRHLLLLWCLTWLSPWTSWGAVHVDVSSLDHCTRDVRVPIRATDWLPSCSCLLLPTPTMLVGVGRISESVCLSVCLFVRSITLRNEWSRPQCVQTCYRWYPCDILEVTWFLGWKVGYSNSAWGRTLWVPFNCYCDVTRRQWSIHTDK